MRGLVRPATTVYALRDRVDAKTIASEVKEAFGAEAWQGERDLPCRHRVT
ncbi:hypothetical protein ACSCBZ_22865 [Streptomyces niveiscabiei]|nr:MULTISPECIES: hypothetical protein [Streptomyces]